jgi:hypothetical protein
VTLSNPVVLPLEAPDVGDESLLLRLTGSFGVPMVIELPFQFDVHLVRSGRVLLGVVVFSLNAPHADDLAPTLLQAMLSRVPSP